MKNFQVQNRPDNFIYNEHFVITVYNIVIGLKLLYPPTIKKTRLNIVAIDRTDRQTDFYLTLVTHNT